MDEPRRYRTELSNLQASVQDADGRWRPMTPDELERLRRWLDEANRTPKEPADPAAGG